jgi:predicted MPP superfamily phosphohydrolase
MNVTLLHLSDLHFRPEWPEQCGLVTRALLADIAEQIQAETNVYLVFSGDFVHTGGCPDQYAALQAGFDAELTKIGLPRTRRVCVPGNHDISRDAVKRLRAVHIPSITAIRSEESFIDALPVLSDNLFNHVLATYKAHEDQFAAHSCCQDAIGGRGWDWSDSVGIYCLNTALCSSGGLSTEDSSIPTDRGRLMVDTRSLQAWLARTPSTCRILVMHHPVDWLVEWAQVELEKTIVKDFHLVLSGHIHRPSATHVMRLAKGAICCTAPALFTRKSDILGYALISIDPFSHDVAVRYREWGQQGAFVAGAGLAGTDTGTIIFSKGDVRGDTVLRLIPSESATTEQLLQNEFSSSVTCYSCTRTIWVDRDLSSTPETSQRKTALLTSTTGFARGMQSCIIRAPKGYGLTALGRHLAFEGFKARGDGSLLCMIDASDVPHHRQGVLDHVAERCRQLHSDRARIAAIIIDNWQNDGNGRRLLRDLQHHFPKCVLVALHGVDDCAEISSVVDHDGMPKMDTMYLWALSQSNVRTLVSQYVTSKSLDEDAVTKKILQDIDHLNIHRTPAHCLMFLKLIERDFDDSPVNRTELISRVLFVLFAQFNQVPRYASKPDLKDCEYALGYLCDWMMRNGRSQFTKNEFTRKIAEYCDKQLLDLDGDVLFAFLVSENIFVSKGGMFEFRFKYWMYFFCAHRMHHNSEFADYILSAKRYATSPEIVEFYAGIDRRRTDAVVRLTADLQAMIAAFDDRTGISPSFKPFDHARWVPDEKSLEDMRRDVSESAERSAIPKPAIDAIADKSYDRGAPYNQKLAKFIDESTLGQMVQMMKGAARTLRNSDHVSPETKRSLFREVVKCWTRVCHTLVLLSHVLSNRRFAAFEGMNFVLADGFPHDGDGQSRWEAVVMVIADNVVRWFQDDLFSRKMGAMLFEFVGQNQGALEELLMLLVIVKQRPVGWETEVENFIVRSSKNSYYLSRVYCALRSEYDISICSERNRQRLLRLAAMSVAKHETGSKKPDSRLIETVAKQIDKERGVLPTEAEEGDSADQRAS